MEGSPGESGGGAERGVGERGIVLERWIYKVFCGLPGFRQAVLFYGVLVCAGSWEDGGGEVDLAGLAG